MESPGNGDKQRKVNEWAVKYRWTEGGKVISQSEYGTVGSGTKGGGPEPGDGDPEGDARVGWHPPRTEGTAIERSVFI